MRALSSCHALAALDIAQAKTISDVGIAALARGCPVLKSLKCHGAFLLADPSVAAASTLSGKTLEPWEDIIGLAAVTHHCPNLETVDVSGCFRLNKVVGQFLSKLHQLKSINMKGCNQCSSTSFIAFASSVQFLETLILSDCGKAINSKVMQAFAQYCPKIKTLRVCRCEEIKESAVRAIANMSQLEILDLS